MSRKKEFNFATASVLLGILTFVILLLNELTRIINHHQSPIGILPLPLLALGLGIYAVFKVRNTKSSRFAFVLAGLGIIVNGLIISALVSGYWYDYKRRQSWPRILCAGNLYSLSMAMTVYAKENEDARFPDPNRWCDTLLQTNYIDKKNFICGAALSKGDKGPCHGTNR